MTNIETVKGIYNIVGNTLKQTGVNFKLIITTRSEPTPKKPKLFLIAKPLEKTFPDGSNYVYISSLYPKNDTTFIFDYQGNKHSLTIKGTEAEIMQEGKVL